LNRGRGGGHCQNLLKKKWGLREGMPGKEKSPDAQDNAKKSEKKILEEENTIRTTERVGKKA